MKAITKPRIAIALGVFVVASIVIAAATGGIGKASVPKDAVAVVDHVTVPSGTGVAGDPPFIKDGVITQADFQRALQQAALRQRVTTVPQPGDPQYTTLRDQALGDLFDIAWITGEAKDQGISVSDRRVADQLAQTKKQSFKTEAKYQAFLKQSGFNQADVNLRVKLQLLSQAIQQKLSAAVKPVSDSDVQNFYNENKSQLQQPETRNIRVILNKDRAQVEQAQRQLQADSSPANWAKVAKQFSTDASSKDRGGVRASITPGVLEAPLDHAVFAAPTGQVSSIVQTPLGYYVFQVDQATPATTQPLSAIQAQLKQQLQGQAQQTAFSTFVENYRSKWSDVTICADGYVINRCDNFGGRVNPCTAQQAKTAGCPPWVLERNPIAPGTVRAGPLASSSGIPQRPHPPGAATAAPTTGIPGAGVPGAAPPGASAAPSGGSTPGR